MRAVGFAVLVLVAAGLTELEIAELCSDLPVVKLMRAIFEQSSRKHLPSLCSKLVSDWSCARAYKVEAHFS